MAGVCAEQGMLAIAAPGWGQGAGCGLVQARACRLGSWASAGGRVLRGLRRWAGRGAASWGVGLALVLLTALLMRGWLARSLPSSPRQELLSEIHFADSLVDELRQGRFPADWNGREFNGFPWLIYTSWPLYLSLAVVAHLSGLAVTDLFKALQFVIFLSSGLAMYLYLRALLGERLPALVAAVAYLWFPCHAHLGVETPYHATVWALVPAILYAGERALASRGRERWRWTAGLAVAAGLVALIVPEYAILAAPSVGGYLLIREGMAIRAGESTLKESAVRLVAAGLAALALAALVLLPGAVALGTVAIQAKHVSGAVFGPEVLAGYAVSPSMVLRAIARRTHLPVPYGGLPHMYNILWSVAWYPGVVVPVAAVWGLVRARRRALARPVAAMLGLALLQALNGLVPGNPFSRLPVIRNLFPFRSALLVVVFLTGLVGFGVQAFLGRVGGRWRRWAALLVAGLILVDFAPSATAFVGLERYFSPAEEAAQRWLREHRGDGGHRLWEPVAEDRVSYRLLLGIVPAGMPRYWGYYDNSSPLHTWYLLWLGNRALALRLSSVRYALLRPDLVGDDWVQGVLARAGFRPVEWGIEGLSLFEAADPQPYARAYPVAALHVDSDRLAGLGLLEALEGKGIALVSGSSPYVEDYVGPQAARYLFADGALERRPGGRQAQARSLGAALCRADQAILLPEAPVWSGERVRSERPAPGEIRVAVDLPEPAVVTVAESWHPYWRATLDGERTTLLRVNYAFLGAGVPAGAHRLAFRYERPPWLNAGVLISLSAWLALAGVAVRCGRAAGARWRPA